MGFIDLLKPQGDKATLNELILAAECLPERIIRPIPKCLYKLDQSLDHEIFLILAWVRARRDAAEITIAEVGDRMGMSDREATDKILDEVIYFFGHYTREEIENFGKDKAAPDEEAPEGEAPENPLEPERAEELSGIS